MPAQRARRLSSSHPLIRAMVKLELGQQSSLTTAESLAVLDLLHAAVKETRRRDMAGQKRLENFSYGGRQWVLQYSNFGRLAVISRRTGNTLCASRFGDIDGELTPLFGR